MIKKISRKTYERNSHIEHFSQGAACDFNISKILDIGPIIKKKQEEDLSFYPLVIYWISRAVNSIREMRIFKYDRDFVYYYDYMNPSYTVFNQESKTFSLVETQYNEDLSIFYESYLLDMKSYKRDTIYGRLLEGGNSLSISGLPWLDYTSFDISLKNQDYLLPIISFGKYFYQDGSYWMNLSIRANHISMDGYHVYLFFQELEESIYKLF